MSQRPVRISVRGTADELLVQGHYAVVHKELSDPVTITIIARDDQGRRASISLPVELFDLVEPAATPLDGLAHGRRAEDRVLAATRL